jgi:6-phosphogluconate dehydrogenase
MIGTGRMGGNMVTRLMRAGHHCVVYARHEESIKGALEQGAQGSTDLKQFVAMLAQPRIVWLMVPAASVDKVVKEVSMLLSPGDIVVDGGNSYYHDDIRRAARLREKQIHYLDVGVSGGIWGAERGYCLMIGGEAEVVRRLDPIFKALAPGVAEAERTRGRTGDPTPAEQGYLHCGPVGGGHFIKMIHNGIEYGMMSAIAEGLNIVKNAGLGNKSQEVDAETAPLRHPELYQYDFDVAEVAELWRRGSVVASWLLDLTASALRANPDLSDFSGRVSDSGEGRWTVQAAVDEGVPVPTLSSALFGRFSSRGRDEFADQLLSAMRFEFGGHLEKGGKEPGGEH